LYSDYLPLPKTKFYQIENLLRNQEEGEGIHSLIQHPVESKNCDVKLTIFLTFLKTLINIDQIMMLILEEGVTFL